MVTSAPGKIQKHLIKRLFEKLTVERQTNGTVAELQTQIRPKIKPVFKDLEYYFWLSRPVAQNT